MKVNVRKIAIFLVFVCLFNVFAPTISVIAIAYGEGDNFINLDINNEMAFTINSVTVNGNNWDNSQDEFHSNNDQYTIIINVTKNGNAIPDVQYGGNWNDYIEKTSTNEGDTYIYTLNLNDSEHQGFVALSIIEKTDMGQQGGQDEPHNPPMGGEEIEITTMEFTINGQACTISVDNSVANVPANTNFESLEEFYITRLVSRDKATNEVKDVSFTPGKYGLNIRDDQNRPILETHLTKQTTSIAFVRVEAHVDDITDEHLNIIGKTREDIIGFYLPQIVLAKPNSQGLVQIETPNKPDVYDFTAFNGIELGDTSINNYGEVTVYYGDDTIDLSAYECNITNIELVENKNVLSSAVEIDVVNKKVKIKSNFYNEIPLKITAQMENESTIVGYVKIVRVGIYINDLNKGANVFYHGAFNGRVNENGGNLNVDTDKNRLVAVFYHDNTKTVNDYDLVVNIINKDGTTGTKLAKPVGDVNDEGSPLVGSDYILWEGDSVEDRPSKIYVTAVKKGATSGEKTFGGATFGAGAGVTWINE